jgi:poly(ribitol-phosphate) beta-N-acetylglucosaminyltransferase
MTQIPAERPLVSLVIPVYNAMPYLTETLDALPGQGLDPSQLEVILVDDGSDDGSERVLAEYAERHPHYRLLVQPNSGGPADPCNKGIAAVRGKYFFVLGADDFLTEGALGDLVAYAEAEGSDIVLAKMEGLNGRHAPGSMFRRSTADAHLIEDKLYNSLTAIKLFRTELVARSGAINPTHLRVGSDQPFTLACYLVADKISVRADRAYVMIRKREDGKNVTASPRSSWDYAQLITATVSVIVDGTEPGELRDGLLRRPVRGALRKALHPRFLALDEATQQATVTEIRQAIGPWFTEPVARHLGDLDRLKARLALADEVEVLRSLLTWEKEGGRERVTHDGNGFRLELPDALSRRIGRELREDVRPTGVVVLEELEVERGRLRLAASARLARGATPPDEVALRVRRRGTDEWFDVLPEGATGTERKGAPAVGFRAEVDCSGLQRGVWDLSVVHRYGADELVNRLGRHRAEDIGGQRRSLGGAAGADASGTAYFTQGYGNLSVDIRSAAASRAGAERPLVTALRRVRGGTRALRVASALRGRAAGALRRLRARGRRGAAQ